MSLPRFAYLSPLFAISAALALSACTYPKVLGDGQLDEDTDTLATSDTSGGPGTTGDPNTTTGTTSTTGNEPSTTDGDPPGVCDNPAYGCSQPPDCAEWNCGASASPFDADGCLRQDCLDSPCGADEICYHVEDKDASCDVRLTGCSEDPQNNVCTCEVTDDCYAAHCIPADEGPPVECPLIKEEAACLAADCNQFAMIQLHRLDENQQCVLDEVFPACLWFPANYVGGADAPGYYYEKATGRAGEHPAQWIDVPAGWGSCSDPDAPPACACVDQCIDFQAQADSMLEQDKPCNDVSDCVLAEAMCYQSDTCGNVGVHKDTLADWDALHTHIQSTGCCDGAAPCGATLACENNRCVAVFP